MTIRTTQVFYTTVVPAATPVNAVGVGLQNLSDHSFCVIQL